MDFRPEKLGAMRNIKLTVAYDGTSYCGFQEQRGTGLLTIQGELERCLHRLSGTTVRVIGAGRTDAGVHARGQVINFNAGGWNIPTERIPLAMNGCLPPDIAVVNSEDVPEDFHARFSAVSKTYRYAIYNSRIPDPMFSRYSYFVPKAIDFKAVREAAALLTGRHDFAAFKAEGSPVKSTVRHLFSLDVQDTSKIVELFFRGDGFLYNMVRIMTGTLLKVGLKKYPPEHVRLILEGRKRELAGPTVPPQGLCLMKVEYSI